MDELKNNLYKIVKAEYKNLNILCKKYKTVMKATNQLN